MKRYMWAMALVGITAAGLMTGCASTEAACGTNCAYLEPNESGCDEGASDLVSEAVTGATGFEGVLGIRAADPDICKDIYWARFAPNQQNTTAFAVTLSVNGVEASVPVQKSDPKAPTLYAWTVAYEATSGDTVQACVTPEGQPELCVEKTLP